MDINQAIWHSIIIFVCTYSFGLPHDLTSLFFSFQLWESKKPDNSL